MMRKAEAMIILMCVLCSNAYAPTASESAERLEYRRGGVVLHGARSYSGAVMSAYQRAYAMNFEIWKPHDLPAGWYATFDGFPVAQIAENRWVYGQIGLDGAIMPTNILVGSVVPSSVPGLARIAAVWSWGRRLDSPEFLRIRNTNCNRMGWLYDRSVNTIIAWNTHRPGVYIWLGDRWRRFEPNAGEYTWQMLRRLGPWIASELHRNNAYLYGGEPLEVADLARQWGLIWGGRVVIDSLKTYGNDGGRDAAASETTSMRDTSTGTNNESTPPENNNNNNSGQWDVD
ncbi:MAG: hypothetical protein IJU07_05485 [Synergistaceae bacterium]|nr:hypothetical protein [Synergistaceae bacterium]